MKQIGRIKWFNEIQGFGFIKTEEQEFFIHVKSLVDLKDKPKLITGAPVSFLPIKHERGMQATKVEFMEVDGNV